MKKNKLGKVIIMLIFAGVIYLIYSAMRPSHRSDEDRNNHPQVKESVQDTSHFSGSANESYLHLQHLPPDRERNLRRGLSYFLKNIKNPFKSYEIWDRCEPCCGVRDRYTRLVNILVSENWYRNVGLREFAWVIEESKGRVSSSELSRAIDDAINRIKTYADSFLVNVVFINNGIDELIVNGERVGRNDTLEFRIPYHWSRRQRFSDIDIETPDGDVIQVRLCNLSIVNRNYSENKFHKEVTLSLISDDRIRVTVR